MVGMGRSRVVVGKGRSRVVVGKGRSRGSGRQGEE